MNASRAQWQNSLVPPRHYIDERLVHREMCRHSLRTMSKHLRRDVCGLKHLAARIADLSCSEVARHTQPFVRYGCRFWVYHFIMSDVETSLFAVIEMFLRIHILYWLESLALLRRLTDAVYMVHALNSVFQVGDPLSRGTTTTVALHKLRDKVTSKFGSTLNRDTNATSPNSHSAARSNLKATVHDATRFILAFRPILEDAPLQVYYAALVSSPNTSIVLQLGSGTCPRCQNFGILICRRSRATSIRSAPWPSRRTARRWRAFGLVVEAKLLLPLFSCVRSTRFI